MEINIFMKILHCSDIHLGRRPVGNIGEYSKKRFEDYFVAFDRVIDIVIEKQIDVVVISGDLFDRKELVPEVLERTEKLFDKLVEKNIQTVLIEGNHDNITRGNETDSWLIYLEKKGYFKRPGYFVEEEEWQFNPVVIDDVNFYGVGYPGGLVNETLSMLASFLENKKEENNIVLVHTAIGSSEFLPGTVKKETIDLFKNKALYMAGGHYHSFSSYPDEKPYFFIPGSLEYWDLAEKRKGKGFLVFDTDSGEYEHYPSIMRNKIELNFSSMASTQEEFKEKFVQFINEQSIIPQEDMVIVTIEPNGRLYVDNAWCEEVLLGVGALKAVVKIVYADSNYRKTGVDDMTGIEEVEQEIIASWEYFSSQKEQTGVAINNLKLHQKENSYEQFKDVFDQLLENLIEEEKESNCEN